MTSRCSSRRNQAITLTDVFLIVIILFVLAVILLPSFVRPRRHEGPSCVLNLMQIGLAAKIWANDHDDRYPFELSVTNGGTMELNNGRKVWLNFLVMSNELATPKILTCPEDKNRQPSCANFSPEIAGHVSYFIGLDARPNQTKRILSGDDNLVVNGIRVRPGILNVSTNVSVEWTKERHHSFGNTLFAGGYVLSEGSSQYPPPPFRGLQQALEQTSLATNRLAIP